MNALRPARKITNSNGVSKVLGLFSSRKMNTMVPWESQLGRDICCYLFEFDKNIEKYISHPEKFFFYGVNQGQIYSRLLSDTKDTSNTVNLN